MLIYDTILISSDYVFTSKKLNVYRNSILYLRDLNSLFSHIHTQTRARIHVHVYVSFFSFFNPISHGCYDTQLLCHCCTSPSLISTTQLTFTWIINFIIYIYKKHINRIIYFFPLFLPFFVFSFSFLSCIKTS